MTHIIRQLTNDPDDPRLSTPEYEFTYQMYKGIWCRHIDSDDPFFDEIWGVLSNHLYEDTFFHKDRPTLEQSFKIGDTQYNALWFKCTVKDVKKIEGPPDVITWFYKMIPPTNIQKTLF